MCRQGGGQELGPEQGKKAARGFGCSVTQSVGCPPTLGTEGEHYRVGHVGVQWGASGGGGCVGAGERAVEPLAGVGRGLTPSDVGPVGRVMVVSGGGGGKRWKSLFRRPVGYFSALQKKLG